MFSTVTAWRCSLYCSKRMNGLTRLDGLTSSSWILSICRARLVAWALEALAEKRLTKDCSSAICALLGVVRQQALAGLFGGGHVLVVAREQAQLAVVQVGHVGADAVQEVAIVGNDDHGAVARGEHAFQPADGVDVQVVGRFVEQQHVRVREQRLGQQHAQLSSRGDGAHRAEVLLQRDAQAEQQLAGAGLGGVAVELGELDFQLGHRHAICLAHFRQRE